MQSGAVDIFILVLQYHDRLIVQGPDRAGVDVAADAVVPSETELSTPALFGRGGLRKYRCAESCQANDKRQAAGDVYEHSLRLLEPLLARLVPLSGTPEQGGWIREISRSRGSFRHVVRRLSLARESANERHERASLKWLEEVGDTAESLGLAA